MFYNNSVFWVSELFVCTIQLLESSGAEEAEDVLVVIFRLELADAASLLHQRMFQKYSPPTFLGNVWQICSNWCFQREMVHQSYSAVIDLHRRCPIDYVYFPVISTFFDCPKNVLFTLPLVVDEGASSSESISSSPRDQKPMIINLNTETFAEHENLAWEAEVEVVHNLSDTRNRNRSEDKFICCFLDTFSVSSSSSLMEMLTRSLLFANCRWMGERRRRWLPIKDSCFCPLSSFSLIIRNDTTMQRETRPGESFLPIILWFLKSDLIIGVS